MKSPTIAGPTPPIRTITTIPLEGRVVKVVSSIEESTFGEARLMYVFAVLSFIRTGKLTHYYSFAWL